MPKKLSEAEVLERMRTAQTDALSNPNPDRAREARRRLRHLIKNHQAVAEANGFENVVMDQRTGQIMESVTPADFPGHKIIR